jgi:hypothetical protein
MLFENYRELVTENAAKEYFGILPEKKGTQGSKNKGKGDGKATAKTQFVKVLRHAASSSAISKRIQKHGPAK